MKKEWSVFIYTILFFMIVLAAVSTRFWSSPFQADLSGAEQGVLRLDDSLPKTSVVPLVGEWRFIPNRLVAPEQVFQADLSGIYTRIAGKGWDSALGDSLGMATYALRVELAEPVDVLAVKTNSIRLAHRLYVNGELIGSRGTLSDAGEYVSNNTPYKAYQLLQTSSLEFVIQVENREYAEAGGMMEPIMIGSPEAMDQYVQKALNHDLIRLLIYLFGGTFFLCLFWMWRTQRYSLYLGLYTIAVSLYVLTHGEKYLSHLLPSLSYEYFTLAQLLAIHASSVCLVLYVNALYPSRYGKRVVKAIIVVTVVFAAITMLTPPHMYSRFMTLQGVPSFFAHFYAVFHFGLTAWNRKRGALFCMLSAMNMAVLFVIVSVHNAGWLYFQAFQPWDAWTFILLQFLLVAQRFAALYENSETLSKQIVEVQEAKEVFIKQNAFHLQEPLVQVNQLLGLALEQPDSSVREQQQHLRAARELLQQELDHVQDLVDFTRMQENKSVQPSYILVKESLESLFQHMSGMPGYQRNQFKTSIPNQLSLALGEEDRFRQAVRKLILASIQENSIVHVQCEEELGGDVFVSVIITPAALHADEAASMMQRSLEQKESFTSQNIHLIMAYQGILQQGGDLSALQSAGGIIYKIRLTGAGTLEIQSHGAEDLYRWPDVIEESTGTEITADAAGRVLLVSSDAVQRDIITAILKREDYQVTAVQSAEEVIRLLAGQPLPDLVISDMLVQGMSGTQLCKHIRKAYSAAVVPYLLMVSPLQPEERLAAFQAEVNDILLKPFDASELRSRVHNLMAMKHSMEQAMRMEQAFLQAQIKPHFLFNAMNSILSLSYSDIEKARQVIFDLSSYLRLSFDFSNTHHVVPLWKEIELVKAYISVELVRYDSRLRFTIEQEGSQEVWIPPITLQPIVENAVRHGIAHTPNGGTVKLKIIHSEHEVVAIITDDGVGMSEEHLREIWDPNKQTDSVGLINISKRLNRLPGASVSIHSAPDQGTVVTLRFPTKIYGGPEL